MTKLDVETMELIQKAMRNIATANYPIVWVGEVGETPEQWAAQELMNAELPEEMRLSPGEVIRVDGDDDDSHGIKIPGVSNSWLPGEWVLKHLPHTLEDNNLDDLDIECLYINAAKRGLVPVRRKYMARLKADLPPVYVLVPLDRLESEDVDEDAVNELDYYASELNPDGAYGPYAIEDTPETLRAVECRLEGNL